MKKFALIGSVILGGLFSFSCEEDDVCVGDGTPNLTVVFRDILNQNNLKDTLTIYRANNPDFIDQALVYDKVFSDSLKLPLGGLNQTQTYFKIQRRSNSNFDVLTVGHQTQSEFVSKACGFRIIYDELSYQATQNHFQYIIPVESNQLKDESETNLYIVLGN